MESLTTPCGTIIIQKKIEINKRAPQLGPAPLAAKRKRIPIYWANASYFQNRGKNERNNPGMDFGAQSLRT
jgi:hypothetical protein